MYLHTLTIQNLRVFDETELELTHPGRTNLTGSPRLNNVNLILGTNGAGKTSVLKAAALGVLSEMIQQSGFRPYYLVRRGSSESRDDASPSAHIVVELMLHEADVDESSRIPTPIEGETPSGAWIQAGLEIERRGRDTEWIKDIPPLSTHDSVWSQLFIDETPAFFIVGYGATRRVEDSTVFDRGSRQKSRALRYERVATLFEEHLALVPLNAWLPECLREDPALGQEALGLINSLLPETLRLLAKPKSGEVLFEKDDIRIPFGALSDGHRAYAGWISDLVYHLVQASAGRPLRELEGVVMVDEIDLHIHPSWQRTIIPQIATALPMLQFVLTSHSAIVVGTLEKANLFHLVVDKKTGASRVERPEAELHGLTADQILTSSVFGLDSTRAPDFVDELRDLAKRAQTDRGVALELMRRVARGKGAEPDEEPPDWVKQAASRGGLP